ncbi:DNA polymerase epsilon subunit 3 [Chytriomyces hyalinus]|nr:DNA polymerase epsilon subunit 3 [Chytriomyces hyalinus]
MNGIEDLSIPKSIVARIVKGTQVNGIHANMQREAKDAFVKSCTVFMSYISTQAASLARKNGRKTITAADVYEALSNSQFDTFVHSCKEDAEAFNNREREKRSAQTKNLREKKKAASGKGASRNSIASMNEADEDDGQPEAETKRARVENETVEEETNV